MGSRFTSPLAWLELGGADDVLVSRTVKDLVAGSAIRFEDFGTHTLKGIPEEWRVFRAVG